MKVLLVDNFDSFTFNLFHLLEGIGVEVVVKRNNELSDSDLIDCDKIILSPGPGIPSEAKGMIEVIEKMYLNKPILGVCLGMQALAEFFGDSIYNLSKVYHGVQKKIHIHSSKDLFKGVELCTNVALYHSWAVRLGDKSSLIPLAYSEDSILMSFKHKEFPIYGIQFHPESILTDKGREILTNFIEL